MVQVPGTGNRFAFHNCLIFSFFRNPHISAINIRFGETYLSPKTYISSEIAWLASLPFRDNVRLTDTERQVK